MTDRDRKPIATLERDPVVSGEVTRPPPPRKYGDDRDTYEMMWECIGRVDALSDKFDALLQTVEGRAPMPQQAVEDLHSIRGASWVIACGFIALVLTGIAYGAL